ncbi:MAG TPA: DNA damage-inducible protein D [Pirellulales bacterium]|nr:DNA damage-inducible protein D [Pirellulales bacterium]
MKMEMIVQLHSSFEQCMKTESEGGTEFWLARDLQVLLGYAQWRNFEQVIERAKTACANSGYDVADHFADLSKMVDLGSGTHREIDDIFERLRENQSFARIRSKGDQALFGGKTTQDMKDRLADPKSRPLADFLPTITIKARDFANEITNFNVKKGDLRTTATITREHVKNNQDVRKVLTDRGIVPEALPPAEDIKKIERRVHSERKKRPKQVEKLEGPPEDSESGEA